MNVYQIEKTKEILETFHEEEENKPKTIHRLLD